MANWFERLDNWLRGTGKSTREATTLPTMGAGSSRSSDLSAERRQTGEDPTSRDTVERTTTMPLSQIQIFFSFQGRITRTEYWKAMATAFAIGFPSGFLLVAVAKSTDQPAIYIIPLVLALWPSLAVHIKRWHDRSRSAWWLLTALVPLVGLVALTWILIEVGFLEGTRGPNRFGPEPSKEDATPGSSGDGERKGQDRLKAEQDAEDPLLRFLRRTAVAQTVRGGSEKASLAYERLVERYGRLQAGSLLAQLIATSAIEDEYLVAIDGQSRVLALTNHRLLFRDPESGSYREFAISDIESSQPDPGLHGIALTLKMRSGEVARLAHLNQSSLPVIYELTGLVDRYRSKGRGTATTDP